MLIVDGIPLLGINLETVLSHPAIQKANDAFLAQQQSDVGHEHRTLCVLQGEQALVKFGADGLYIGSEDATTCLIAVVICKQSGLAWAAHFDDRTCRNQTAVAKAVESCVAPELYLVGGYEEPSGVSSRACNSILNLFHGLARPVDLRLACIHTVNADASGAPRSRQLVVNCLSGTPHPFTFKDRGPEVPRRMASHYCLPPSMEFMDLVDTSSGRLILPELQARTSIMYLNYFEWLLGMDDPTLLQNHSTSPDHEGPKFVPDMRAKFHWLLAAQSQLYFPAAQYEWKAEAGWVVCEP